MDISKLIQVAASTAHKVNLLYSESHGEGRESWQNLTQEARNSVCLGVIELLKDPHQPESSLHDSWCVHKREQGWKFGVKVDIDKKEHPCLVEYSELSAIDRRRDELFKVVVLSIVNPGQVYGHILTLLEHYSHPSL